MAVNVFSVFHLPKIPTIVIMKQLIVYFLPSEGVYRYMGASRISCLVINSTEVIMTIAISGNKIASLITLTGHESSLIKAPKCTCDAELRRFDPVRVSAVNTLLMKNFQDNDSPCLPSLIQSNRHRFV